MSINRKVCNLVGTLSDSSRGLMIEATAPEFVEATHLNTKLDIVFKVSSLSVSAIFAIEEIISDLWVETARTAALSPGAQVVVE